MVETLAKLAGYDGGEALLCAGGVFTPSIIASYRATMLGRWRLELSQRIIPAYMELVRQCSRLHDDGDAQDDEAWAGIQALRVGLMKNLKGEPALFTRLRSALAAGAAALGSSFLPQPTKAMVAATAVKPAHWSRERLVFIVMREPPG